MKQIIAIEGSETDMESEKRKTQRNKIKSNIINKNYQDMDINE